MTKAHFAMMFRVSIGFLAVASATAGPGQTCTPIPDTRCSNPQTTICSVTAEWFRDNQGCSERTHEPIYVPQNAKLKIQSAMLFKVNPFKVFAPTGKPDDPCDWNTPMNGSQPFDEGDASTKDKYTNIHVLKAKLNCYGCYEVNFSVKGQPPIDPHIIAGGKGNLDLDKACPVEAQ